MTKDAMVAFIVKELDRQAAESKSPSLYVGPYEDGWLVLDGEVCVDALAYRLIATLEGNK